MIRFKELLPSICGEQRVIIYSYDDGKDMSYTTVFDGAIKNILLRAEEDPFVADIFDRYVSRISCKHSVLIIYTGKKVKDDEVR